MRVIVATFDGFVALAATAVQAAPPVRIGIRNALMIQTLVQACPLSSWLLASRDASLQRGA